MQLFLQGRLIAPRTTDLLGNLISATLLIQAFPQDFVDLGTRILPEQVVGIECVAIAAIHGYDGAQDFFDFMMRLMFSLVIGEL